MTIVELSHPLVDGDIGYPGLPAPRIRPHRSHAASAAQYADGSSFEITHLSLVANSGTYLDSPAHRFPGLADIAQLPLSSLVDLPLVVVDAPGGPVREVVVDVTPDMTGAAVVLRTGWDVHRGTDRYFTPAPFLAAASAEALAAAGVVAVGTDAWNVDDTTTAMRPVHTALLGCGVVVVEHLRGLGALPLRGARLTVVPLAVVGAVTMPVRAWATLPMDVAPREL